MTFLDSYIISCCAQFIIFKYFCIIKYIYKKLSTPCICSQRRFFSSFYLFILINMGVWPNLHAPLLIPRILKLTIIYKPMEAIILTASKDRFLINVVLGYTKLKHNLEFRKWNYAGFRRTYICMAFSNNLLLNIWSRTSD